VLLALSAALIGRVVVVAHGDDDGPRSVRDNRKSTKTRQDMPLRRRR
jgi:hypothetical protein